MTGPDFWISYGLPAFGVAFGLGGLTIAWIAARRFDARFEQSEAVPAPIGARPSLYRKRMPHPHRGSPVNSTAIRR